MALGKKDDRYIYLVFLGMLFVCIAVVWKLSVIQFRDGDKWRSQADSLMIRDEIVSANRGNIFSADGSLLATSIPKYNIYFDPTSPSDENFEKYVRPLSDSLAKMFNKKSAGQYETEFRKLRSNKKSYKPIASRLSYTEYVRVKNFPMFNLGKFKGGLIVDQIQVREYPMGMIANRTIGYERKDADGYISRKGIEAAFSNYLTGKDGKRKVQRMSKSLWKPITDDNLVEPEDGLDVITTIDVYIQDIAHHALLNSLEYYAAHHGTVVVMETETGHIKAISNLGLGEDGQYRETVNYAVLERHDPGSTFKLASYLALLDSKKVDTATIFDTYGGIIRFGSAFVRDSNRRGYGQISLGRGFEVSSNTVVTQAVSTVFKDNPKDFTDRLESYGMNSTLGLELKGEPKSYIPLPGEKNWSKIALPWMAYGYGILLTPLQTLTMYNAVANDGEMVRPQFVKEIKKVNETIKLYDKSVINPQIASPETIKKMQQLMKNVVTNGTGKKLYSPDFPMAGKTGTAQMNYGKGKGEMYYASSFVGYFPADQPKYSCIVVIHRPTQHSYYGGDVAGPVFKRIAQKIFTDVPSLKEVKNIEKPLAKATKSYKKYYADVKQTGHIMPNVIGLNAMDAVALLENLGAKVITQGFGKVSQQSIEAGSRLSKNTTITLILG